MTRKLVLLQVVVALVCFSATMALAAMNPDTGPGCGVGKVIWADYRHQKNILPQSLMWTTNATFTSPIGITFGVSGCTNDGKFIDRKSTRLNSSHLVISYAVFCLKKKKKQMVYMQQYDVHI